MRPSGRMAGDQRPASYHPDPAFFRRLRGGLPLALRTYHAVSYPVGRMYSQREIASESHQTTHHPPHTDLHYTDL